MANLHPFAMLNHKNADSGIPYVSLTQWDLVLEDYPVSFTHSDRAGLGQGQESTAEHSLSYGQGA